MGGCMIDIYKMAKKIEEGKQFAQILHQERIEWLKNKN